MYLSLRPLLFLSTLENPATTILTLIPAPSFCWPPPNPPCNPPEGAPPPPAAVAPRRCPALEFCSEGPVTTHMTLVFPISRYDEPSAASCVRIWAWRRRSSFQRRPSTRRSAREYVDVSRGMAVTFVGWIEVDECWWWVSEACVKYLKRA